MIPSCRNPTRVVPPPSPEAVGRPLNTGAVHSRERHSVRLKGGCDPELFHEGKVEGIAKNFKSAGFGHQPRYNLFVVRDFIVCIRVKVTLLGIRPPDWRRILLPREITLGNFQRTWQTAMGWTKADLHQFVWPGTKNFGLGRESGGKVGNENKTTLHRRIRGAAVCWSCSNRSGAGSSSRAHIASGMAG